MKSETDNVVSDTISRIAADFLFLRGRWIIIFSYQRTVISKH
jgi:hypothetical protein